MLENTDMLAILNLIVLTITLGVLIWYTVETRRIANQTVESSLRPIILYIGWIKDWDIEVVQDKFGRPSLQFQNQRNIATDIKGTIVVDKKKYQLLFANTVTEAIDGKNKIIAYLPKWVFLPATGVLSIAYETAKYIDFDAKNEIYIEYSDIEGNGYFTKIDETFSVVSGKCSIKNAVKDLL